MRQFFSIVHIRGDGHCGFRSVAFFIYGHEDFWQKVRYDLLGEIQKNRILYESMGLDLTSFARRVACSTPSTTIEHWYSSHECSIVAATCYKRPVVLITRQRYQNAVYIPILSEYSPGAARHAIFLHFDYNHYEAAVPYSWESIEYPRIDPQTRYQAKSYATCKSWLEFYEH